MVTIEKSVTQPLDSTQDVFTDQIDLALELSKQLSKNIRQGQNFRIVGWGGMLRPQGSSGDADTGISAAVNLQYCPTTKHSRKAWNYQYNRYVAQKKLNGRIGKVLKYDDFELAYEQAFINSRTSGLYATGLGDTNLESACIYGTSTAGTDSTLQDVYDSMMTTPNTPQNEFGVSLKPSKYQAHFPSPQTIGFTAHQSSVADWTQSVEVLGVEDAVASSVHYMGGTAHDSLHMLGDYHLNVLGGLFKCYAKILPPDVNSGPDPPTAESDWKLIINIAVAGWSKLVYPKPKRRMYVPRRINRYKRRNYSRSVNNRYRRKR